MLCQPLLQERKQVIIDLGLTRVVQGKEMLDLLDKRHVLPPVRFFVRVVVFLKQVFLILEMEDGVVYEEGKKRA